MERLLSMVSLASDVCLRSAGRPGCTAPVRIEPRLPVLAGADLDAFGDRPELLHAEGHTEFDCHSYVEGNQSPPPVDLRRVGAGVRFVIMVGFGDAVSGAALV